MRILIVHTYYQAPGGEDTVFEQESKLLAENHEVRTITFQNKKGMRGALQTLASFCNIGAARRLKKVLLAFAPDVVHIHNTHYAAGPLVIRTIAASGIPQVMTLHNFRLICPSATLYHEKHTFLNSIQENFPWSAVKRGVMDNSRLKTFVLALNYWFHKKIGTWQLINRYIVLTNFARGLFIRSTLGIPAERFIVKPNFVFPYISRPSDHPVETPYFIYVGRLSEEKGILNLIEVIKNCPYHLKIVGGGPLEEQVRLATADHPNIDYLGFKDRKTIAGLIAKAEALLVPSVWFEGMPMTILESFAVGTPVLCSDIGGLPELVIPEKTGLLFDPLDPQDIFAKVVAWSDKTAAEKDEIRQTTKAFYFRNFTPEINKEKLLEVYTQAITDFKKRNV